MKILIIEDEQLALDRMKRLLYQIDSRIQVVGELDSIVQCKNWLYENAQPDAILLDIHLSDGSGMDLISYVPKGVAVVFTTAFSTYAIDAFKVDAVDYLLKPIKEADLARAVMRIQNRLQSSVVSGVIETEENFMVKRGNSLKVIAVDEVAFFYSVERVTLLVKWDGTRYPIDSSLDKLETTLNRQDYIRLNRQCILHCKAIRAMHRHTKGRLRVYTQPESELELVVSSAKSPSFKKWVKLVR